MFSDPFCFLEYSMQTRRISEVTRRAVIDELSLSGTQWAGRLSEVEFLSRIYDLSALPSTDRRCNNAEADIHQHRISWTDWEDDWIFHDSRFELLRGTDEVFLRFVCEMIHPVVRPSLEDARRLATAFNAHLRQDGVSLMEVATISEHPVFAPSWTGERASAVAEPTGWEKVDRQLREARVRLETAKNEEQFQAVGMICREVIISVAQEAFDPEKHLGPLQPKPSDTDAASMLESFFSSVLAGGSNEEARA